MATIPTFIFDMDGTLVDNMPFHNRAWFDYLTEAQASFDPHTFHDQTAGKTNPEVLRMIFGTHLSDEELLAHGLAKEERYRATYQAHIQPLPGLLPFLERARQAGIRLALATSAWQENIDLVLAGLGLQDAFEVIVNGSHVQRGKPDPQAFELTLERLNAAPGDAVVFEDSRGGIESARRAGLPVVAILTGLTRPQALEYPNVRLAVPDYQGLDPLHLF